MSDESKILVYFSCTPRTILVYTHKMLYISDELLEGAFLDKMVLVTNINYDMWYEYVLYCQNYINM